MPKPCNLSPIEALNAAETVIQGSKATVNAYEITVERLSAAIKMGLYRPGDQLPTERDLADIMGVSRTTVREAIRVLSAQGFLSVKRGRTGGTFVCEALTLPSVRELKQKLEQRSTTLSEILDYRLVMEPGVAELAAQRANSQQLDELQSLVGQMKQAANHFNDHRHLDTKFHLLIASATQSRRLTTIVAGIHAELSDLLAIIPHSPAACCSSTEQHQQILDALREEQANLARRLMADHIDRTQRLLNGLLG
jgi:DNA-binding FadR family transcriptional regulator